MNRYKNALSRAADNPNVERKALNIPDAPPIERELHPFARFAAIAVASAVLIAGGIFSWQYTNGGFAPGGDTAVPRLEDTEIGDIRGLPAENYCITMAINDHTMPRNGGNFYRLCDLFCPWWFNWDGTPVLYGIVVAYVLDEQTEEDTQIASLQVLRCVEGDLPGEITVEQGLSPGAPDAERTNFLRKGGVYVLVVGNWRDSEYYDLYAGDHVLFEVDDNGLIASHSSWQELRKYDGKPLTNLWGDITYLAENPSLTSAMAGHIMSQAADMPGVGDPIWKVFMRATVTEKTTRTKLGNPQTGLLEIYNISVSEYLHNPENREVDSVSLATMFDGRPYNELEVPYNELEVGKEYIFNGFVEDPFYYLMLDEDGRIVIPPDYIGNAFKFADGMTLDELREAIAFVCDFYGVPYAPSQP